MSFFLAASYFFVGMLISFFLPFVYDLVKKAAKSIGIAGPAGTNTKKEPSWWEKVNGKSYLTVVIGAYLLALALVLYSGSPFENSNDAIIAGVGWESLLGKVIAQNKK